jgi:hypothetical protein
MKKLIDNYFVQVETIKKITNNFLYRTYFRMINPSFVTTEHFS